jgi:GNAT superfamily N-acetyltransferase
MTHAVHLLSRARARLTRARIRVVRCLKVVVLPLHDCEGGSDRETVRATPVHIRPLAEGDLGAYRSFRPRQSDIEVRARLAAGQHCCAAWTGSGIVSACWAATGRLYIPYLWRDLVLREGDVYFFDAYTKAEHRGQGYAPAVYRQLVRHFGQAGYKRVVGILAVENREARAVTNKLNFRVIGCYWRVRAGSWQRIWCRAAADALLPALQEPEAAPV